MQSPKLRDQHPHCPTIRRLLPRRVAQGKLDRPVPHRLVVQARLANAGGRPARPETGQTDEAVPQVNDRGDPGLPGRLLVANVRGLHVSVNNVLRVEVDQAGQNLHPDL